jgi:hypothetical protein
MSFTGQYFNSFRRNSSVSHRRNRTQSYAVKIKRTATCDVSDDLQANVKIIMHSLKTYKVYNNNAANCNV